MSRASDYATSIGNLYQLQAQNVAQANQARANAGIQKAQIIGGTLSNLGQMVAGLPQAMRERKIAGLREQEALQGMQDKQREREQMAAVQQAIQAAGGDIEKALPDILQKAPAIGMELQTRVQNSKKLALELKHAQMQGLEDETMLVNKRLATVTNPAEYFEVLKGLELAGINAGLPPTFDPSIPKKANEALRTPQERYVTENPLPVVTSPGQQGFNPRTGEQVFENPYRLTPDQEADNARQAEAERRAVGAQTETERHNRAMEARPVGGATTNTDDVKETVAGMIDGTLPPVLPGRATKEYNALMAEAHRQGFDLAGAATDWAATQKHIATMNGAQQLRLNQSVKALPELLDTVETLAGQWKGGAFPPLNKANLLLAKNGAYGPEVASVANQLDTQIADVVADLGNVYMGGNSPTDHALELAGKALNTNWSEKVLKDMVALAKKNVQIRRNSINSTGVAGASPANPYASPPPAVTTPTDYQEYQRLYQGGR